MFTILFYKDLNIHTLGYLNYVPYTKANKHVQYVKET